jgi:HD-GYP domain-containing protein (c-di-GMP phosphodiesterase class II)
VTEHDVQPAPPERPDDRTIETVLGPKIVTRLFGLMRAVRLYDLSNQAVRDQLRELLSRIAPLMEEELVVVAMGQCFYINGLRVRAEPMQAHVFQALTKEFESRRLGGIRFLDGLREEELGNFLRLLVTYDGSEQAGSFADMAAGAGVTFAAPISLDELHAMGAASEVVAEDPTDTERGRARQTFARAVHGARGAITRTMRTGKPAVRRVKRVVQPIVDSIMRHEYSIVGLTAIKNHDEYTYAHCVNVSILAVAAGQCLGLSRGALANLGVAALLHDIGKVTVPSEVLGKPGRFTEGEWKLMHRHPIEGLRLVTRMPGLSPLMLDMLNVCLHHHLLMDGTGYPRIGRESRLSTASRIVSVADCFDAMTAHRTYRRRPFTGYEALQLMLGAERTHFDPAALWALVRSVGLYPAGTLMLTRSGHLVVSLSPNPEDIRRPVCQVVVRPDGSSAPGGDPPIWDPMAANEAVVRVVSPEEYGGESERLLAA